MKKVKIITSIILALLLMLSTTMPLIAVPGENSNRIVKMGYFEFGGMFEGADRGKYKSGYCYEYMMQIANYTGWNYEFVYGTYSDLYEKLLNGEIDVLPYTNYNEQRGQEVLFSDSALLEEEYYIAVNSSGKFLSSDGIKGLNDCIISTLKGADYNQLLLDYIQGNDLHVTIKYYDTLQETWNAMKTGVVNATVYTSNAYSNDGWKCLCSFGKKPTYVAFTKDVEDLLDEYNDATRLIEMESPAFLGNLYEKYFSDNPMRNSLTAEEELWFKQHPVLRIGCFTNDAPYIYSWDNDSKTATGLTVDLLNDIARHLGFNAKAEYLCFDTLEEMEQALDEEKIDVIIPFYPDYFVAQQHNLIISNVVRVSNMELVYPVESSYQEALTKIATPTTKLGVYYVKQNFPDAEIVAARSIQDAVDKVLSGDATGAIAQNVVMHNIKENYNQLTSVVLSEGCGTCFATRPENYPLIRILNRGLNYFTSAEISAFASKYNLEHEITTKAYLASHKEVITMIILTFVCIVALLFSLALVMRLRRRANQASEAKTTFLFNMSHDIRTPMNAITGFTDKAIRHKDDPEILEESLGKIKSSSTYLLGIINDILDMAKIESGKLEIKESLNCTENKHNTLLEVFGAEAHRKGIQIHAAFEIKDSYLWMDEGRMSQILANLLSNAIKYTDQGGEIWYTAKEKPASRKGYGKFIISVKDTGCGMSKDFQKKIFDAFERDATAIKNGAQGTGLGMSIVKKLVDAMGGTIDIQSDLGKGTTITICVEHRIATPDEIRVYQQAYQPKENDKTSEIKGKRVLVVEDNELNREIAVDLLEEEGLLVDTAEDGKIALQKVKDHFDKEEYTYYSAVLMDIQMPNMNGYDATKAIRKLSVPENVHLPIIAMTANAFDEDRQNAFDAGMDEHIAKPINVKLLFEILTKYL